jgi:hypothetical protein
MNGWDRTGYGAGAEALREEVHHKDAGGHTQAAARRVAGQPLRDAQLRGHVAGGGAVGAQVVQEGALLVVCTAQQEDQAPSLGRLHPHQRRKHRVQAQPLAQDRQAVLGHLLLHHLPHKRQQPRRTGGHAHFERRQTGAVWYTTIAAASSQTGSQTHALRLRDTGRLPAADVTG